MAYNGTVHYPAFYFPDFSTGSTSVVPHDYNSTESVNGLLGTLITVPAVPTIQAINAPNDGPLTITPSNEIGILVQTQAGLFWRWFAQDVGASVDMQAVIQKINPYPNATSFAVKGYFYIVDDVIEVAPGTDGTAGYDWIPAPGTTVVYNTVDVALQIVTDNGTTIIDNAVETAYNPTNPGAYYHNGWRVPILSSSAVDTGTEPVTLDFGVFVVGAQETIWDGGQGSYSFEKTPTGAYLWPTATNRHYKFSMLVTVTTTTWTAEGPSFEYPGGRWSVSYATRSYSKVPDHVWYVYEYGAQGSAGGTVGTASGVAADMLQTRAGFYIAYPASGMIVKRFASAFQAYLSTVTADSDGSAVYPTLCYQTEGEGVLLFYRRGAGSSSSPYQYVARTSYDNGLTWFQRTANGTEIAVLTGKKWARIAVMGSGRRSAGEAVVYNDASGKDVSGNLNGTGLMQCDLYDASGTFLGTFPADGKGILATQADDAGFGLEYVSDHNHDLRLCFFSGGTLRYAVSTDEGRTWLDITSQMGG